MSAFYNEHDAYPAQWIRNLATAGHVAPGVVDERSIKEVQPADVGNGQVHLFAGIAIWSAALRAAGFADEFPVWSCSCPCQPFSSAGRGEGTSDPRHLWPDAFRLIDARRPVLVVGEQVASPDGLAWLDAVFTDLEGAGYSCRAVDICAAGFGAPHIRQRLYWAAISPSGLAHHHQQRLSQQRSEGLPADRDASRGHDADGRGAAEWMADDADERRGLKSRDGSDGAGASGRAGRLGYEGLQGHGRPLEVNDSSRWEGEKRYRPTAGFWGDVEWLPCRDGKWRPTQPGLFPLAHGAASRVGRLRAYGNGLVLAQATEFCAAVKQCLEAA